MRSLCVFSVFTGMWMTRIVPVRIVSKTKQHSQLFVSRRPLWWKLEKSNARKFLRHLHLFRRFPLKTFGWKNCIQKLLEAVKTPNKPQKIKKSNCENGETCEEWATIRFAYTGSRKRCPVWLRKHQREHGETRQQLRTSVRRTFRSRQRRRRKRRRRSNKHGSLVKSGKSIGLFTQREKIDIDFRVSGLPHAVAKQAGTSVFANSWRRSRVILIKKHFKPICSRITSTTQSVTIRKRWFVKWAM